jgi:ribosomal protein L21
MALGASFGQRQPVLLACTDADAAAEFCAPMLLHLQVIVYKMKAKKHYRRLNGHRQPLSKILITSISA